MSILSCVAPDCDEPVFVKKRQLCKPHYHVWYRTQGADEIASTPYQDLPPRRLPGDCPQCGIRVQRQGDFGPVPTYCSGACRAKSSRERRIAAGTYKTPAYVPRKRARELRACAECGVQWHAKSGAKCCSQSCNTRYNDRNNPKRCTETDCDRGVRAKGLCNLHWRRRARAEGRETQSPWDERRKANYQQRRALKLQLPADNIRPADVYERDEWVCSLCALPVDRNTAWPDPMSPSLDHVLPLSLGGHHTMENVALAHLSCNVRKGNRVEADAMSA